MDGTLQTTAIYPRARAFVLKLHRDSALTGAGLRGHLEHPDSGARGEFSGIDELLEMLAELLPAGSTARFVDDLSLNTTSQHF